MISRIVSQLLNLSVGSPVEAALQVPELRFWNFPRVSGTTGAEEKSKAAIIPHLKNGKLRRQRRRTPLLTVRAFACNWERRESPILRRARRWCTGPPIHSSWWRGVELRNSVTEIIQKDISQRKGDPCQNKNIDYSCETKEGQINPEKSDPKMDLT